MPIGPRGEPLPYGPTNPGMGVGPGPDRPPQMPPIEAVVARIQELQAELQQLVALAEQMGAGRGPDLPPGIPQGGPQGNNIAMEYEASKGQPGLLG